MKFTQQDYTNLKTEIVDALTKHGITIHHWVKTASELKYSEIRMLWDLYWLSDWHKKDENRNNDYLDTHITSALRAIVKDLQKENIQEVVSI
ncbi:MAG: hypothetical protein ABJH04_08050 [Cyclobacteriaceae bacterium]